MSSPLLMPPWTPPLRFVLVPSLPSGFLMKASLWTEPANSVPLKPEPISKPLVAGIESMACASLASSLSNTGSPRPTGERRITQVTVPPIESALDLASMMRCERVGVSVSCRGTGMTDDVLREVCAPPASGRPSPRAGSEPGSRRPARARWC